MAAEILAPAGSPQALTAAVRCGANAVYLGGQALNARRNAANFSDEELAAAISYCHARNVKVYLTLNTLVGNSELKTAYEAIQCACELSADALILQDIGLASLARQAAPAMPLHASTQMSVQSVQGAYMLRELGFTRIVLPRELSEKEIADIAAQTDLELECFVHGALCMCVSGQCLMSAALGGRSGNRGLCAQPCRLPFGINEKGGNALSLKDLSLIDKLDRLEKAGVCSFKIEGRMKRPEYVAAAVTACKNSLARIDDEEITAALQAVFSRSGFTAGYFEGKRNSDMFGTRRKEDVESAAQVLAGLRRLYDNENPLVPVDFSLDFRSDSPLSLRASALDKSVSKTAELTPATAVNKPLSREELAERISKCGGTQFYARNVEIDFEEGLNTSAGALNSLRRSSLAALDEKLAERRAIPVQSFIIDEKPHKAQPLALHARFFRENQIPKNLSGISRVIVPIETKAETIERLLARSVETAVEIPACAFGNASEYIEKLLAFKALGVELAWACTLDGIGIAKAAGMNFACGFGMNIFNSPAISRLDSLGARDCLVSCEMKLSDIARLGGEIPRGAMAYGRMPLMMTRCCPVKNKLSCAECGSRSKLVDRMGIEFLVVCKNSCSFVLNSRPLWLADKLNSLEKLDFALLYFTSENKDECEKITADFLNSAPPTGEFTRGLYSKGVL